MTLGLTEEHLQLAETVRRGGPPPLPAAGARAAAHRPGPASAHNPEKKEENKTEQQKHQTKTE
jgi:ribosomal protein L12E/L44/L45/RPP1/RPP2